MSRPPSPSLAVDGTLLAGRNVLVMRRRPAALAGAIAFPVVFTLLFFTVFERVMGRIGIDYAQFVVPAVVIQAMFFTGMSSSILAAEDAAGGMLGRLRSMPVARSAPFTGLLLSEVARAVVSLAVLVPLGLALGFRFDGGLARAAGFVALALGFVVVACAGYIALGLRAGHPDTAQALNMIPYFPLLLVSNAFAPTERFPAWLQPIVSNQPISQVADGLRALAADGAAIVRPVGEALAWLVPLLVLFTYVAARAFGRER